MGSEAVRLSVELVPASCWCENVRSVVTAREWDRLRKAVYARADNKCEICGEQGRRHPVECHEIWSYDDTTKVQRLERLIALCPSCHEVKHLGLAEVRGRARQAMLHLQRVNGWTEQQTIEYVAAQFDLWAARSKHAWKTELEKLNDHGVVWPR